MRALLVITFVLATACQPKSNFELTTDRTSYAPGVTITLELRSNVIDPALYNLCFVTFLPAVSRPSGACQAIAVPLESFGVANGQAVVPEDAAPGDYQLQTRVEVGSPSVMLTVSSDPFSVGSP